MGDKPLVEAIKLHLDEIRALKQAGEHDNIIKYEFDISENHVSTYIFMEYCDDGDLRRLIRFHDEERKQISEDKIFQFLIQMLSGVTHLHLLNIIHRDIKPE